ncbi:TetR/AcrR family transcriptional regulator [Clostridium cylindrosporum]|uniref:Transcriptional regulator, TetR family n=1 Tax=Clostridium cylindrosporum DSM 605 TaxID=1121307 RepID=A0A0J8DF04_CLOCY|nr:TetR/AcrR family transcriptional regulator [Clostridium cylindrosporum]KMT22839.1 transcriptional regulator, TetR family [Clostridium cylindrosporum DSM 605]
MDEKQKLIMNIAQELFDERGFQYTSIDDIAKACKISKATFYKYFANKEVLVYDIIDYANNQLYEIIDSINSEYNLNGIEKLKKKIITSWEHIFSQTIFSVYITKNFSKNERENITDVRKKNKGKLFKEFRIGLIEAFGNDVKPFIWDLVFILDSLIHEFILLTRVNKKEVNPEVVGSYIVKILGFSVETLKDTSGLIDKSIFSFVEGIEDIEETKEGHLLEILNDTKELIEKSRLSLSRVKLLEGIEKLYIEIKEKRYDSLMVDAILALFEKEDSLKAQVILINNIISELKEEV